MKDNDNLNKIKEIKKSYNFLQIPDDIKKLAPNVKFESYVDNILSIKLPSIDLLPPIPPCYGYKGGAARLALGFALNYNFALRRPRDIDIVRFGNNGNELDEQIEKIFMKDDLAHGHGIEILPSIEKYFATRDITINEILILNGYIYFTLACLLDLYYKKLRPTEHVLDNFSQPDPKITMKIIRLKALGIVSGEEFSIINERYNPKVSGFHIALHLDRALEQNQKIANEYIYECIKYQYLPKLLLGKSIGDIVMYLYRENPSILSFENLARTIRPKKQNEPAKIGKRRILL